jgi:hypothetical protein
MGVLPAVFYEAGRREEVNRDDIIRIAKEAGGHIAELPNGDAWVFDEDEQLERFAALIAEPLQERIKDLYRQLGEAEKQLDRQYAMGIEDERERCVLILERLHERSGGQYNYYAYAATVLKGEI